MAWVSRPVRLPLPGGACWATCRRLCRRPPHCRTRLPCPPAGNTTTGGQKCYYCPVGSVALDGNGDTGKVGSVTCDPWCVPLLRAAGLGGAAAGPRSWAASSAAAAARAQPCPCACLPLLPRSPPGTIAALSGDDTWETCVPCQDGWYRSGDATNGNNVCRKIPAGWKERNRTLTTDDRAEITLCAKGEVSFWDGEVRTPLNAPESCQPCTGDNKYAPRTGMTICQPCPGGTYPSKSDAGLTGNDYCAPCTGNTYRPFTSTRHVQHGGRAALGSERSRRASRCCVARAVGPCLWRRPGLLNGLAPSELPSPLPAAAAPPALCAWPGARRK